MSLRGPALLAVGVALVLALFVVLVWLFQRRLIYIPYPSRLPPVRQVLPGGRQVTLETEDGLELGAWFLAADGEPSGAILVMNGNAGNRAFRADLAEALAVRGLDVLLFDYRGYGGNPGNPTEQGLIRDARAARRWLAGNSRAGHRLLYFGESLGTGVAVALAVEHPPGGLVLRSPFPSLTALGRHHYPFLPVGLLLRDRFPSARRIADLQAPLLVIAGDRDTIVPLAMSRRLFEAASGPKELVIVPGADHNDFALLAGERMMAAIDRFLDRVLTTG